MGVTYKFVHDPSELSPVLTWFRALDPAPREVQFDWGVAFHFEDCGPIQYLSDGTIDEEHSPVVALILPKVRRKVLWTVGELRIPDSPLKNQYPALHRVSSSLFKWLGNFQRVFALRGGKQEFDYYLEGSVRNSSKEIFAFESGLHALSGGRYFVSNSDNDMLLDGICKRLRLRGIECQ